MKTCLLILLLFGAGPLAAQEASRPPQPQTALESLGVFKLFSRKEKLTGMVELRGTGGLPTPELWRLVIFDPLSPTKLSEFTIRGPRVEERGPNREYYPQKDPTGYFEFSKVNVDCAGAFRIADREAGKAKIGFDSIDYRLRAREYSDEPVWTLTLRTTDGAVAGNVSISAVGGKVLRTVWMRSVAGERRFPDDSAVPAEFRPPPPPSLPPAAPVPPLPDPFPASEPAVPNPLPAPIPAEPELQLPPPPPLPPLGNPPPVPRPD